jgi:hypothetical protein
MKEQICIVNRGVEIPRNNNKNAINENHHNRNGKTYAGY